MMYVPSDIMLGQPGIISGLLVIHPATRKQFELLLKP